MHLELTTRCTLACPGCPRTWFEKQFNRPFPKQDLDLDQLAAFLDCDSGRNIQHFSFNGNHGDPIYYPELLTLMAQYRSRARYSMSTNGSYQTPRFWHEFSELLEKKDTVYFSIDGLENSNHLYRRNADWPTVMAGLDIVRKSPARVVWKSLIFRYNQHQIEQMRQRAEDLGVIFVADVTHRFGDPELVPDQVDSSVEYQLSQLELEPQCARMEYISADGYYWPCTYMTSYYSLHQTELWRERDQWHIADQTLDQARTRLYQWADQIRAQPEQAHQICKMHCKKGQIEPKWTTLDR